MYVHAGHYIHSPLSQSQSASFTEFSGNYPTPRGRTSTSSEPGLYFPSGVVIPPTATATTTTTSAHSPPPLNFPPGIPETTFEEGAGVQEMSLRAMGANVTHEHGAWTNGTGSSPDSIQPRDKRVAFLSQVSVL